MSALTGTVSWEGRREPGAVVVLVDATATELIGAVRADAEGAFSLERPAGAETLVIAKLRRELVGTAWARVAVDVERVELDGAERAPACAVEFELTGDAPPSPLPLRVMPRTVPGLGDEAVRWLFECPGETIETALREDPIEPGAPVRYLLQAGPWRLVARLLLPMRANRPGARGSSWIATSATLEPDGTPLPGEGGEFELEVTEPCRVRLHVATVER